MIVLSFLQWWYSYGWKSALEHSLQRIEETYRLFSIPILLRTLFAPWKRIITPPGASLGDHFRAGIDNAISRCVGFLVRSIVLCSALLLLFFVSVISLFELLAWPFMPLTAPVLFLFGVITL